MSETPMRDLVRSVPKELRGEWESQWFEDGTPSGHAMAPVRRYLREQADKIESQAADIERLKAEISDQKNTIRQMQNKINKE